MGNIMSFIPRERHNVKHSIAGCFKATTANISAYTVVAFGTTVEWKTRVCRWQTARRLWPDP